jgi:thiamine-phosphate pyrophosphorylase
MAEAQPRLYLISPPLAAAAPFSAALEAALTAGDVACVLLRLETLAASDIKKILTTLVPLAQKHDAAVLLEDPSLAGRFDADGVHAVGLGPDLDAALAAMKARGAKEEKIVGVGGIASRHDAMTAGEAGVDYLMFGAPAGQEPQTADAEMVAWWAEISTVPCVAFTHAIAGVAPLARAGAEFIALGDAVWQHEGGAAAAVEAAMAALAIAHEPAR